MATTKQASESDAAGAESTTKRSRRTSSGGRSRSRRASASRSSSGGSKRSSRSRSRRRSNGTVNTLMARGRSALNQAYGLAEQAGSASSRAVRKMPDTRSLQTMMDERPLLLGAVGLGIGVLIGAMLPSMHGGSSSGQRGRHR